MPMQDFINLGICEEILDSIKRLGWSRPSSVQTKAIPHALHGRDVVSVAGTGSGKTAAFAIPILQELISKPRHNFALILTPTRELAIQLRSQFFDLGEVYGLKVLCLVGGQHVEDQMKDLKSFKYHVIIGTPGRIVYHLNHSKELRLNRIHHLVLDEADNLLDDTFEEHLQHILSKLPPNHRTHLYSATLSPKVQKIRDICTKSPVVVDAAPEYTTVRTLDHAFVFIPDQERDVYLVYLLSSATSKSTFVSRTIVFTTTWRESFRIAFLLKVLSPVVGGMASPLNGMMQQDKRQAALFGFRTGETTVLVATDLAARGLDIPHVDLVINYDVPRRPSWSDSAKAYIHRVGRTARAGRSGRAITLVTPYSATRLKVIEASLGGRVPQLPWPGVTCVNPELRSQISQANNRARADLYMKDKKKKLLKKKRLKQQERQTEAFADPIDAGLSDDEDD